MTDSLFIGLSDQDAPQSLVLKRANRHGLIAGATGTGKTVTLQGLAEGFSRAGVPVFLSDVKGDIAGMAKAGSEAAAWTGKRALELNASAVILVHNHPSGDPTPSQSDISVTLQVQDAANALGIVLHDHLIIGKSQQLSFKAQGYL